MVHTVFQTDFLCPADVPLRFVVTVTVTVPSAQTGSPLSNLKSSLRELSFIVRKRRGHLKKPSTRKPLGLTALDFRTKCLLDHRTMCSYPPFCMNMNTWFDAADCDFMGHKFFL